MTVQAHPAQQTQMPLEFRDSHETLGILGFWLFLASDVVLFACLFAVYAVFHGRVAAGPTPLQIFHLGPVLTETVLLLTSSFTCGIGIFMMRRGRTKALMAWLALTMLLGLAFVGMEITEFTTDVATFGTWHQSAFLSSFFTLVGTHGGHVSFGILWAAALLVRLWRQGITQATARRVYTFSLYWHFLDIIWIFLFTVVYLSGKIT
jgi:heme/copper-type cytochrome/quinol oxidase subunit 3